MRSLRDRLQPFDVTYRLVRDRIDKAARSQPNANEGHWLHVLNDAFMHEYAHWGDARFEAYWRSASRLRPRLLWLAAAAYLHISYDLPRVIANTWPGVSPWAPTPTENSGELIYFQLNPIFLDVFRTVARDRRVVGNVAPVLRLAPWRVTDALAHWAMHLRTASWLHAAKLRAAASGRAFREQKMLEAMTAALDDVSNLPWSAAVLLPPHEAVLRTVPLQVLPVIEAARDHPVISGFLLGGLALGIGSFWYFRQLSRREREITRFVDELGARVVEYTAAATGDPEGFDRYRLRRTTGS